MKTQTLPLLPWASFADPDSVGLSGGWEFVYLEVFHVVLMGRFSVLHSSLHTPEPTTMLVNDRRLINM